MVKQYAVAVKKLVKAWPIESAAGTPYSNNSPSHNVAIPNCKSFSRPARDVKKPKFMHVHTEQQQILMPEFWLISRIPKAAMSTTGMCFISIVFNNFRLLYRTVLYVLCVLSKNFNWKCKIFKTKKFRCNTNIPCVVNSKSKNRHFCRRFQVGEADLPHSYLFGVRI